MNNKFWSDYLPPAMVRDLRCSMHTRSYCITLLLVFLAALWVQSSTALAPVEHAVFSGGIKLAALAAGLFWFIIPNRAGAAVAADAKVRSSNFLALTPLSSRSIIWQIWLSAATQILIIAAVGSLFLVWRHALAAPNLPRMELALFTGLPTNVVITPQHDWLIYGIIVLGGLLMSAVSLFLAQLNRIFRIAGLIFMLLALWGWLQNNIELFLLHPNPLHAMLHQMSCAEWLTMVVAVLLSIVALLELARRCYASPAENCSRLLRVLVLLPLLIIFLSFGLNITSRELVTEHQLPLAANFMLAVCLSDALLPAPTYRNCAEPMLPGIPHYLQQNGSGPAALFLVLMLCLFAAAQCWLEPVFHHRYPAILAETAALAYYLLAGLWLTDMVCRRSAPNRPVYGFALLLALMFVSNMALVSIDASPDSQAAMLLPGCGFICPHNEWSSVLLAALPAVAILAAILHRDKLPHR